MGLLGTPLGAVANLPVTGVLRHRQSATCLTVPEQARNLTLVALAPCTEGGAQSWTVTRPLGSTAVTARGLCPDAYRPDPAAAGPAGWVAQLYACNGSPSQTWQVTGGVLRNSLSGACLDQAGGRPVFAVCTGQAPWPWQVPNGRLQQGAVQFADEFDGAAGGSFDRTRWSEWSACTYNPSAAFGGIGCGTPETLDGAGHLLLPADPTHGSAIRSTVGFTSGVFSAWLRNPAPAGYWPAFWMLNTPMDGSPVPDVGEVDVMEASTTWPSLYHATSHVYTPGAVVHDVDHVCGGTADLSEATHNYSVRVEPGLDGRGRITYYLDDRQCGAAFTPATNPGQPWTFPPSLTRPLWMILDLAVGGAGGAQTPATAPAALLVDRVEVRALR